MGKTLPLTTVYMAVGDITRRDASPTVAAHPGRPAGRRRVVLLTSALTAAWGPAPASGIITRAGDCCRFTTLFGDNHDQWNDAVTQESFVKATLSSEKRFFAASGVAFDKETGMTFDGHPVDPKTGELVLGGFPRGPRTWSSPSREAFHLNILTLSIQPQYDARVREIQDLELLVNQDDALDTLEHKITSLEDFNSRHPAFGGFLPWFCSRGSKSFPGTSFTACRDLTEAAAPVAPTFNFKDRLSAAENGQFAWAVYALLEVLEARAPHCERSKKLLGRWDEQLQRMRTSAVPLFHEGMGQLRALVALRDASSRTAPHASNAEMGYNADPEAPLNVDDPYEGEMMALFVGLLAECDPTIGSHVKDLMWRRKQHKLASVPYTTEDNVTIIVQEGLYFDAHEQMKFLVLPYSTIPIVQRIFVNTELARLHHARAHSLPGILAAATPPAGVRCDTAFVKGHCGATGVQALGQKRVLFNQSVSPYGAFAAILADRATGLAWYRTTLALPRMQSRYGSLESSDLQGLTISPTLTWESKAPTVLAMLGGTSDLVGARLKRGGLMGAFTRRVQTMYENEFSGLVAMDEPAIKSAMPPHGAFSGADFSTCTCRLAASSAKGGRQGVIEAA